jgi:transcriptional regulator
MYVPPAFRLDDPDARVALMRDRSFALLITSGPGGIATTPIPFLIAPDEGPHGTLYGHVARPNPQTAHLSAGTEAIAWFQGPHAYVSPRWYASRAENVPTWNYTAVEARGHPRVLDAAQTDALVALLGQTFETGPDPWRLDETDARRRAALVHGITAFALPITTLAGKAKLNQNKSAADRAGVVAALWAQGDADALSIAALMAAV